MLCNLFRNSYLWHLYIDGLLIFHEKLSTWIEDYILVLFIQEIVKDNSHLLVLKWFVLSVFCNSSD